MKATKSQIKALESMWEKLEETKINIDIAIKTDGIGPFIEDYDKLRVEALKNKKPKSLIQNKQKVGR